MNAVIINKKSNDLQLNNKLESKNFSIPYMALK